MLYYMGCYNLCICFAVICVCFQQRFVTLRRGSASVRDDYSADFSNAPCCLARMPKGSLHLTDLGGMLYGMTLQLPEPVYGLLLLQIDDGH